MEQETGVRWRSRVRGSMLCEVVLWQGSQVSDTIVICLVLSFTFVHACAGWPDSTVSCKQEWPCPGCQTPPQERS